MMCLLRYTNNNTLGEYVRDRGQVGEWLLLLPPMTVIYV